MIDSSDESWTGYGLMEFCEDLKRYLVFEMKYELLMMLRRLLNV